MRINMKYVLLKVGDEELSVCAAINVKLYKDGRIASWYCIKINAFNEDGEEVSTVGFKQNEDIMGAVADFVKGYDYPSSEEV